jgi:hypothetical protein
MTWFRRTLLVSLSSVTVVVTLVTGAAHGQQLEYSSADRATVRVIALKGTDLLKERINGEDIRFAVANAGHGTGVLVSADGLVVTAHHVVEGARHVVISKLDDPNPYLARLLADDPTHDVAILGIAGVHKDFVPLPTSPPMLSTRQTVFAIGYPKDIRRSDPQSSRGIIAGAHPSGLLQLNISINPGNSGGPVLDERDRLLGIAVSTRKDAEGIAFVVPTRFVNELFAGLDPVRRSAVHKSADDRVLSDQLLGRLVVGFAQQVHMLEGISEGIDRDHLATMRALIELILGEHHDSPDVLALVAGYLWNEALVLRARGDEEWQSRQLRSMAICSTARRLDSGVTQRSPFVSKVLSLQAIANDHPQAPPPASPDQSAAGFRLPAPQMPTPASRASKAQATRPVLNDLGGFRIGSDFDGLTATCLEAGRQLATTTSGYRCLHPGADISQDAVIEFRMCPHKVCRISMHSALEDSQRAQWLAQLKALKKEYEDTYGPPQKEVKLPRACRDDILPCLRDGTARIEYRWGLGNRTLSITLGRRGNAPEMVVSLSKML